MKLSRLPPLLLLTAGAVAFPRAAADPPRLVRVAKTQSLVRAAFERLQIDVAQELAGCYLIRADREDLADLRGAGVAFSVLDPGRAGGSYALVRSDGAPPPGLPSGVKVALVEADVFAVWEETGRPLDLPPGLEAKPLPAFSILPYLERPNRAIALSPGAVRSDSVIDFIVGAVDASRLLGSVRNLQGLGTRYASTPACEAAGDMIFQYFQALGLRTSFEPFTFRTSYASRNVIAEKPGAVEPEEIVVICGHYDSYSNEAATLAPGADDDASGTAAVMEAARLLAPHVFDFTVRFIAFSAEEWGLYGSAYHASRARSAGERIVGIINLDMIAYADASPEDLELIVNEASGWLADRLGRAASTYTSQATRKIVNASLTYSDHSPFWDRGYAAVLAIEDEPLRNPYYHRTTDTAETLDPAFFAGATRAALAALSELAQPVVPGRPGTPAGLTARIHAYSSLFTGVRNVQLSWAASPGAAGYNIYRSAVSRLGYQKLNAAPRSGTAFSDDLLGVDQSYFYAVTAVASDGGESNFSRQIDVPAAIASSGVGSNR